MHLYCSSKSVGSDETSKSQAPAFNAWKRSSNKRPEPQGTATEEVRDRELSRMLSLMEMGGMHNILYCDRTTGIQGSFQELKHTAWARLCLF